MSDNPPQTSQRLGKWFTWAALLITLGLLTLFFQDQIDRQRNPNRSLQGSVTSEGVREVHLQRNHFGHYVSSGQINGHTVEFMLDTGASDVSIPANLAQKLQLPRGAPRVYQTANGPITAYATLLEEVRIGSIVLRQVRASINPAVEDIGILLGMSALKQLEFTQRGEHLILRQYPE